jgi:transcriptional regulator with XRE-family HTH domain
MACDYKKLNGRIREYYDTYGKFAEALGISRSSLSQKINGRVDFTQSEIMRAVELLEINLSNIGLYFFKTNV